MNAQTASPLIFSQAPASADPLRQAIREHYLADETQCVKHLLSLSQHSAELSERIQADAAELVSAVREKRHEQSALDAFMHEYDLSSQEGVLLMCLAEALLRIPDTETAESLIRDKLAEADWESHVGHSHSLFVNASTWGLMLTGRIVRVDPEIKHNFRTALNRLVQKSGEPFIRMAIRQAMRIMGHQFVMGRTIEDALARARNKEHREYRHSYDMLGEAAVTEPDAQRYHRNYQAAIAALAARGPFPDIFDAPGISVKLSALHPRFEHSQHDRIAEFIVPRLRELALQAKDAGIALNIDSEEADRLEPLLDAFEAVYTDPALEGWHGFGMAVQAYQKRGLYVIDWLYDLGRRHGRSIPVRLVKGAYWDTEIKHAQELGLAGYPVFTRKLASDVAYLACARRLLEAREVFYPQFATHNAHTIAAVVHLAGDTEGYELQRLHGMGQALYDEVMHREGYQLPCRVYAPVGSHEELLPYLVRRLLENGANTSFVNRIVDDQLPVSELIADPVETLRKIEPKPHTRIPLPRDIYGPERPNSRGVNLADDIELAQLAEEMAANPPGNWEARPLVGGEPVEGTAHLVADPADNRRTVGHWQAADEATVERALAIAVDAQPRWDRTPVAQRAAVLERAADLLEARMGWFMTLCIREAGKNVLDSVLEIREAIDFLRYYALQARRQFGEPLLMPGPTGESNQVTLHGRGVFACVSPWNFPQAIFTGQVSAALVAGNAVLAKPAEESTLIAYETVKLLHEAGAPTDVLQFVPGTGETVGAALTADPRVIGVAFTGSNETARRINQALADREGAIASLIAETGGQNAMIVDSSALPEQVVKDVVRSAFGSAGQRCSACRVLYVQEDVADKVIEMLAGAMAEIRVGDPGLLATDVGPVISDAARRMLSEHAERMDREGRLIAEAPLPPEAEHGTFFAPRAYEIDGIDRLEGEVFGPILHVIRYRARDLDAVVDAINGTGYGLTLGVHSRIESTAQRIAKRARVGNCYINRNIVGSVVGVQPFGGERLSGTGPKAGGPHYLSRFATERTLTVNTAAIGGNASLLALNDTE